MSNSKAFLELMKLNLKAVNVKNESYKYFYRTTQRCMYKICSVKLCVHKETENVQLAIKGNC